MIVYTSYFKIFMTYNKKRNNKSVESKRWTLFLKSETATRKENIQDSHNAWEFASMFQKLFSLLVYDISFNHQLLMIIDCIYWLYIIILLHFVTTILPISRCIPKTQSLKSSYCLLDAAI